MAQKPQIAIYGFGYVGQALWRFLKDHYIVEIIDPALEQNPDHPHYKELLDKGLISNIKQSKTKYAIICVPTPMAKDGSCDTQIVEEVLSKSRHQFYLIKSTVVPGTTDLLVKKTKKKIAFSPEYIGEGKYEIPYWKDLPHPTNMKLHSFHIFGGAREVTTQFINLWQKVAGWSVVYQQTNAKTAELVKYMENSFLATKKIFCDEFYEIANALGVDYNELKELWLLDGRMGRSMTLIFPDSRGFSGKCLPKDTSAVVKFSERNGYEPKFLKEMIRSNKRFRKED